MISKTKKEKIENETIIPTWSMPPWSESCDDIDDVVFVLFMDSKKQMLCFFMALSESWRWWLEYREQNQEW